MVPRESRIEWVGASSFHRKFDEPPEAIRFAAGIRKVRLRLTRHPNVLFTS